MHHLLQVYINVYYSAIAYIFEDDSYEEEMEIPSSECSNAEKLLDIVPNDNHSNSQYNSIGI